jgi:hypothetical protein
MVHQVGLVSSRKCCIARIYQFLNGHEAAGEFNHRPQAALTGTMQSEACLPASSTKLRPSTIFISEQANSFRLPISMVGYLNFYDISPTTDAI